MNLILGLKRFLLGQSIASQDEHHERLSVPSGLAIFASDALSSSAYATEEILLIFMTAAYLPALWGNILAIPISIAIFTLLCIVVMSYREVIRAYSDGGGAYVVVKENLGRMAGLVVGAALMLDFVLTVSVSISAGVAALTSAFQVLLPYKVLIGIGAIALMTFANLRGMKESARVFAFPTYLFIGGMTGMIFWGVVKIVFGYDDICTSTSIHETVNVAKHIDLSMVGALLLVKAFSSGCTALTGIEAVSVGVKNFKEPSQERANMTLAMLAAILSFLFLGITLLATMYRVMPSHDETVISLIAHHVFGTSPLYYFIQFTTMIILILAANTSFNGFPRLCSFLAADGWVPRQFGIRGDKLVFSNGIMFLGIASAVLIILFKGSTHALIPLYAIGVFISFTLAQGGLFKRQWLLKPKGWLHQLAIIGLGTLTTGLVTIVIGVAKFHTGAWMIIIAIPILIWIFFITHRHYDSVQRQLALREEEKPQACDVASGSTVLVLISNMHRGSVHALKYAKSISNRVEAIHVAINPDYTQRLQSIWNDWGCGVPLVVLPSPFRYLTEPILDYIDSLEKKYPNDTITIIIPEFVTKKWWHNFLHNQSAMTIKVLLRWNRRAVVTSYRFYLDE